MTARELRQALAQVPGHEKLSIKDVDEIRLSPPKKKKVVKKESEKP